MRGFGSVVRCGLFHDHRFLYFGEVFLVADFGEIRLIAHRVLFHQRILLIALFLLYRVLNSMTNVHYAICIYGIRLLGFFVVKIMLTHFRWLSAHHESFFQLLQFFHVGPLDTC